MKSFVAFLVISSFAYLAMSQSACSTAPTGCSSCSSQPTGVTLITVSSYCTACNSGFLLVNSSSSCTANTCGTGCLYCNNNTVCLTGGCAAMYGLWATTGVCVACGTNAATCTATSATAVTITACSTGYVLVAGACLNCATSAVAGNLGVPNCVACTAAVSPATYVTCTACASTYGRFSGTTVGAAGTTAPVSAPFCFPVIAAGTAAATYVTTLAVQVVIPAIATLSTGCTQFVGASTTGAASPYTLSSLTCLAGSAAVGYACATDLQTAICPVVAGSATATVAIASTTAVMPIGCSAGTFADATDTWGACSFCLTGFSMVGTACVANVANCAWMSSTTLCGTANAGYHVPTGGIALPTACAAGLPCSSGCPATMYQASNGTCITGTPITNCWFHNSTSNCVLCAPGYFSAIPGCQACPSNCANCTSSACQNCSATFTLASNGSCQTVKPSGSSSANVLLSGLAFISMIFYYVL